MKKNISFKSMRKVFILSASFLFLLNACKKEGELTPDFIEDSSSLHFTDDITVLSYTRKGDSVLADKVSTGLVGYYQDSVFGKTLSSIYVQPTLPSNALVFGAANERLIIDSLVLSLEYANVFGDSSIEQTIDVFQLDEKIDVNGFYYSDTNINVKPNILGTKSFKPKLDKPTTIIRPNPSGGSDTISLSAQIRIKLDTALGAEILSKSGGAELSNNSNFTTYFKGLKITPNTSVQLNNNESAISYIALTASETKMTIYYRVVDVNGKVRKSLVDFPINTAGARFNTFKHDYTGSVVEGILNKTNTDSLYSFTQSMAGVETVIKFPKLSQEVPIEGSVINKAELVFPVANGSYAKFGVPRSLILASRNEAGALQFIPDFFEGVSFFGGEYNPLLGTYSFNVTRYVQGLLNGTQNEKGLTLLVSGSAVNAERVVIHSENTSDERKLKLNLYYSNTQ